MAKQRTFDQKFWEDRHGRVVVWQKPNKFLITWLVTTMITWFTPAGGFESVVGKISLASLIVWAFLELTRGVNYFRRTVGFLVLVTLVLVRTI